MNQLFSRTAAVLLAAAALASCSRSQYAFRSGPAYHAEIAAPAAPVTQATDEAALTPAPELPELSASVAPVPVPAQLAPVPTPRALARPAAVTQVVAAAPKNVTRAEQKALRRDIKQAVKQARHSAAAPRAGEGKSQLTALLLAIFLGYFGVHRFYLGYTGRGILYLGLLLTSWLFVPLVVLAVLVTIDIVRLITGDLTPKNGSYAETLGSKNKAATTAPENK
jgi:TM2 domain-containing membrane protein YozV